MNADSESNISAVIDDKVAILMSAARLRTFLFAPELVARSLVNTSNE